MSGEKIAPPAGLPGGARKVFQGKLFEVWQWDQKMFDGSTEVFERVVRPDTVYILATVGDRILIEEQEQPGRDSMFFSLPGGVADHGDPHIEEAKRELLEETGYASDDWYSWRSFPSVTRVIYTAHYFVARNCKRVAEQKLDPGERIATKLVSFDELLMYSEEPLFRGVDIANMFLRIRLDPKAKEEFRKLLFPDA